MLNYVHAAPGDDLMGHMLSIMPLLDDDYSIHALLDGADAALTAWAIAGWFAVMVPPALALHAAWAAEDALARLRRRRTP